jgi:hypothetical protein
MGSAIVVGNKSQDALAQVHEGGPTGASEQAANQDREPDLNLVQPGTVPGSVDKANAMGRIREKGGSRLHRGQMTAFALDTEILLNATQLGYQTDQRFGLMRVELIGNEDPARMRIGLNGLYDVSGKVGFRAGGSNTGSHNLASGYIQIGDQTQRAMPFIFEFLALDVTRLHGQGRMETFESLDAGHLIGACHMRPRRSQGWCSLIHLTYRADLRGQFGWVIGGWSEPVALAMRLQSARLLKSAPPYAEKSVGRCHV